MIKREGKRERKRGRERKSGKEGEREKESEKDREREGEKERLAIVIFKRDEGCLAPFSYLLLNVFSNFK